MASSLFNSVKILKGGVITGTEKATGNLTTSLAFYSFGGSSDLWGTTWTPTDVNTSDFGVVVSFRGIGNGTSNLTTHYAKLTNFGFTIPTDAIINGILVEVKAKHQDGPGTTSYALLDYAQITVTFTQGFNIALI